MNRQSGGCMWKTLKLSKNLDPIWKNAIEWQRILNALKIQSKFFRNRIYLPKKSQLSKILQRILRIDFLFDYSFDKN